MANLRAHCILCVTASTTALMAGAHPAQAKSTDPQQAPASEAVAKSGNPDNGEIIVTARKRQESLLNVPVVEQVVTGGELVRHQTVDLKDLTQLTPGLMVGTGVLSIGQLISLRGVGTSSFDPGIDQSVSLNIDGLPVGQGLAFSSGMFDIGQVEVLEGPQALFFGKSSPGGVISLRTADPTDKFEMIGRFGYEAEAHTRRGELIVSGPVSDTLKLRLAGMYQKSDGFYYNAAQVPNNNAVTYYSPGHGSLMTGPTTMLGGLTPAYDRMDNSETYQIRGTALWNPADNFEARLKVNFVHDYAINPENFEITDCPNGTAGAYGYPFIAPNDSCAKGRTGWIVDYNPANFTGIIHSGVPFVATAQQYGTLELNYHPQSDITLTSVTGYYNLHSTSLFNTSGTGYSGPILAAENPDFGRYDVTEEVRANSDFTTPFNFTLGGFYQHGHVHDLVTLVGNSFYIPYAGTAALQNGLNQFTIDTYSVYGQLRYKITPKLELAAGARWTDETRVQNPLLYTSLTTEGLVGAGVLPASALTSPYAVPVPTPRIHSAPVTPEVTLTYKPNPDLTLFGAYKIGAKSGSFSIATPQSFESNGTWLDNSFGDEHVHGGEIGIKGRLADRQVRFSLSGYDYLYTGLQVGAIVPTTNSVPVIETVNAGRGRVYGFELAGQYRPTQIGGLSLNGALNWTHARFSVLDNAPCFGGQTVAMGCNQEYNASSGLYFAQNLDGYPFVRAPDWQANFGFDYSLPAAHGMTVTFSNSNHYTSSFWTGIGARNDYVQDAYLKVDLSVTLTGKNDRWELALIGNNITDRLTTSNCTSSNYANGLLGGQTTGGTTSGPAGIDQQACYMDPGRELWIRLTLKPFG